MQSYFFLPDWQEKDRIRFSTVFAELALGKIHNPFNNKCMKKFFTTLLAASLMLLGTQAFAQMSVNAGYLNSTLKTKNSSDNANGAYAGVSFNVPLAGGLAIAPGVYYSMIISKETASLGSIISGSGTFVEHAVNVPVYLNYVL